MFCDPSNQSPRKSQASASAAFGLQSSATLGTGKPITHQQRLEEAEDKEVRRAMDGRSGQGKRRRRTEALDISVDGSDGDDDDGGYYGMDVDTHGDTDLPAQDGTSRSNPVVIIDSGFSTKEQLPGVEDSPPQQTISTVGSALKRNADGSVAAPRVAHRKPKVKVSILLSLISWRCVNCVR